MSKCTQISSVMIVDIRSYSKSQLLQGDFASRKEIFVKTDSKIPSLEIRGFRPEGQPMSKDEGECFAPQEKNKSHQLRNQRKHITPALENLSRFCLQERTKIIDI